MKRGNLIYAIALFLVSILLLRATLNYPFKAKVFPLIILFILLILLMIQIVREVLAYKEKGTTEGDKGDSLRTKHLTIWIWMAGTVLMLWVLGFMGTVILLPFLYLRFKKESWLLSITLSLGCGIFFYGLFGYLLKMPLYPGMIFENIFG
jgi:hypothetical protein